jgi:hypothetical protein
MASRMALRRLSLAASHAALSPWAASVTASQAAWMRSTGDS